METQNAGRSPYEVGFDDHADGKTLDQNPYWNGEFTKLGNRKLGEETPAAEWQSGWHAREQHINRRVVSKTEADAATRATDLGQFRKRYRRVR